MGGVSAIVSRGDIVNERDWVRDFINDHCIVRVPPGSKDLLAHPGTGGWYEWQFYLRAALFEPRVLRAVTVDFLDRYAGPLSTGAVQLAGVESASTPLLTAFALASAAAGCPVNVFSIRKERKAYGLRNWIEGRALQDVPALLVDDIVSEAHATAIHGANVLADHGIPLASRAYALVYKTMEPERPIRLLGHDVTIDAPFSLRDFNLTVAEYNRRHARVCNIS